MILLSSLLLWFNNLCRLKTLKNLSPLSLTVIFAFKTKNLISELFLTYSWWWLLVVVITGLLYAALLYYKNPLSRLSKGTSVFLFLLRFLSISILAFLLLSPFIKTRIKIKEKPIVVVGVDNSQSLVLSADSLYYKNKFPQKINRLIVGLGEDYQTDYYLFGSKTREGDAPDFRDKMSDYSSFFKMVKENYRGLNVGAVVVAGDGLYNRGTDPVYDASGMKWPIYTIALGDTATYSDLKINDVRFNQLVYLNDEFPVEVSMAASKLKGRRAVLRLYAFGKLIKKKSFLINSNRFTGSYRVMVPASEKGKHRVRITLTVFDNELNRQNNVKSVFVNVLNTRQKVLIVAASPHPDLSAIRQSLTGFRNYKVEIQFVNKLTANPKDFDLIIFHQVPSMKRNPVKFLKLVKEKKIPVLFILGRQSAIPFFNRYVDWLSIISPHGSELAQPVVSPRFTMFSYDKSLAGALEKLPPLTVPFGNYKPSERAAILAYQKINNLETDLPLILFHEANGAKEAVITGEGLWLWKMHDYLANGNFDAVQTLLGKTVQYLTARADKRHFRIIAKEDFQPDDKVVLKAELYDDSWELINDPEVKFTLINEQKKQFKYSFTPYEQYYTLRLDNLSPGVYQYSGSVKLGDNVYSDRGEFVVNAISIESRRLQADFNLLYRLASESNGKMIFPQQMDKLPRLLKENQQVKTRIVFNSKTEGLNNIWYILALVLLLLSLEWFLRKYFGLY